MEKIIFPKSCNAEMSGFVFTAKTSSASSQSCLGLTKHKAGSPSKSNISQSGPFPSGVTSYQVPSALSPLPTFQLNPFSSSAFVHKNVPVTSQVFITLQ